MKTHGSSGSSKENHRIMNSNDARCNALRYSSTSAMFSEHAEEHPVTRWVQWRADPAPSASVARTNKYLAR